MENDNLSAFLSEIAALTEFAAITSPSVMMRSPTGTTPLHIASIRGNTGLVRTLLEAGADPNAVGERGATPLHAALAHKHLQVARMLIVAGSSLDAANIDGITARELTKTVSLWETES